MIDSNASMDSISTNQSAAPMMSVATSSQQGGSLSAISLGFVTTAILISLFILAAIVERMLRRLSLEAASIIQSPATQFPEKMYTTGVSVLMPGQKFPTYIANRVPIKYSGDKAISCSPHEESDVGSCSFDTKSTPNVPMKSDGGDMV